jgi:hypothetical protein
MPDRDPTLPLYRSLRLRKNCCILLLPFLHCHAHLWRVRGGRALGGGEGEFGSEILMIADDEMNYFLHFYMKAFRELEDNTVSTFCFCFFNFCFVLCMLAFLKTDEF